MGPVPSNQLPIQRNSVSGVTILARSSSRGSIPPSPAKTSRSFGSSRGRATCRRNTATSCRNTSNSTSFTAGHDRERRAARGPPGRPHTEQRTTPDDHAEPSERPAAEVFEPHGSRRTLTARERRFASESLRSGRPQARAPPCRRQPRRRLCRATSTSIHPAICLLREGNRSGLRWFHRRAVRVGRNGGRLRPRGRRRSRRGGSVPGRDGERYWLLAGRAAGGPPRSRVPTARGQA